MNFQSIKANVSLGALALVSAPFAIIGVVTGIGIIGFTYGIAAVRGVVTGIYMNKMNADKAAKDAASE